MPARFGVQVFNQRSGGLDGFFAPVLVSQMKTFCYLCIRSVVPMADKNDDGIMCGLYYMDEKIYQTSTAAATDEL